MNSEIKNWEMNWEKQRNETVKKYYYSNGQLKQELRFVCGVLEEQTSYNMDGSISSYFYENETASIYSDDESDFEE